MADIRPQYGEEAVGANHPTKADVINRAFNVEHSSDGIHNFAAAAANLKLFWNAAGTAPEWATGLSIISATRAMTAASGNVAYTGVGFLPRSLLVVAALDPTSISIGISAGTT